LTKHLQLLHSINTAVTVAAQHGQSINDCCTAWTSCCTALAKGTYNCKSPGPEGVHSSSPLSVGNCPLCRQHRLHYEGVDDGKEEHAGIQRPQHICEACLTGHLVSASSHDSFHRFQKFHRNCLLTPLMSPVDTKGTLIDGLDGWLDEGMD